MEQTLINYLLLVDDTKQQLTEKNVRFLPTIVPKLVFVFHDADLKVKIIIY